MEQVWVGCQPGRARSPALLASLLLLIALLVSAASKTPSREECRAHIEHETESACHSPLAGALGWLGDYLFTESRHMQLREQVIARRQHDLVKLKVDQGLLPREALRQPAATVINGQKSGDQPSLFRRLWSALVDDSRLIQLRSEAIAAREQDLQRHKREHKHTATPQTLEPTAKEMKKQKQNKKEVKQKNEQNQKSTPKKLHQSPKPAKTPKSTEEFGSNGWLYDILFSESRYLKLRNEAIAKRKQDLIRMKVSQGELPEEALFEPDYLNELTGGGQSKEGLTLWDKLFSESRQFEIRRRAIQERNRDLIQKKIERGESTPEALYNLEKHEISQSHSNNERPSIWDLLFPERKQLKLRAESIERRKRDLILTKIRNGELSEQALEDISQDDNLATQTSNSLWEMIFADGRHMKIRQQALAKRNLDLIRSKIDRGELTEDALEAFTNDETTTERAASLLQRIGDGIFSDSRLWKQRNEAIAEREANLLKVKRARKTNTDSEKTIGDALSVSGSKSKTSSVTAARAKIEAAASNSDKSRPTKSAVADNNVQTNTRSARATDTAAPATTSPPAPVSTVRSRAQLEQLLGLNAPANRALEEAANRVLRELSQVVDSHVGRLQTTYKYSDISARTLGETELFSKSMIVFLGQLNSGKSTMINYLLGTEATTTTALPGSGQFRVLTYGERDETRDGTQVTRRQEFSGLANFGETFLERLSGRQMKNKLLERTNIVDVPGIMEGRQYGRIYPFNDVCQWFIDRADLIFVVFDPHHLDIGVEMENLLDQLKGHENQIRIVLNKADQLPTGDLLRVQSGLVWSLSPLLGSGVPPLIYSGSFIGRPCQQPGSDQLFQQQEQALLQDIAGAMERRVANRVALARRYAIRVRNHVTLVDGYLKAYLSHLSFLSNKKRLADDVIGNPHKYRIYEGISRVANISRYDMPNPDIYEMFFSMNPLYEFSTLESMCTYFGGCPLQSLETMIHSTLPDLLGRYQKTAERLAPQKQQQQQHRGYTAR